MCTFHLYEDPFRSDPNALGRLGEDCRSYAGSNTKVRYFDVEIQAADCNTHFVDSVNNAVADDLERRSQPAEKRVVVEFDKRQRSRSPADTVIVDKVEVGK